jgi:hypothetical protein
MAFRDSDWERHAVLRLDELVGSEGIVIEHSARSLLRRSVRLRLVQELHAHRQSGLRLLLVRRLDLLGRSEQVRLCLWLASGRPGADWIVATGRLPPGEAASLRLETRVANRFKPRFSLSFGSG